MLTPTPPPRLYSKKDLPDSYFDMLDGLLTYRHKQRKCAKDMLNHEFVQFHRKLQAGDIDGVEEEQGLDIAEVAAEANIPTTVIDEKESNTGGGSTSRKHMTKSVTIRGTVQRHTMYMGYQRFERSLTALLATLLSKEELNSLIEALEKKVGTAKESEDSIKLQAIKIYELREILESLHLSIA
jgi:hypothetical protein